MQIVENVRDGIERDDQNWPSGRNSGTDLKKIGTGQNGTAIFFASGRDNGTCFQFSGTGRRIHGQRAEAPCVHLIVVLLIFTTTKKSTQTNTLPSTKRIICGYKSVGLEGLNDFK